MASHPMVQAFQARAEPMLRAAAVFSTYIGPGFLVAVGYMDPGNWATGLQAGSQYGYTLLYVIFVANVVAVFLQGLAIRLGIVTGLDLAQASRRFFPKWVNLPLYVMAELAVVATDLAEVVGSAIAINLLTGLSLPWGVALTALDTLFVLAFYTESRFRYIECLIAILVLAIGVCFLILVMQSNPVWTDVLLGFIPQSLSFVSDRGQLELTLAIVGATVMPHSLILGSSLCKSRDRQAANAEHRKLANDYITMQSKTPAAIDTLALSSVDPFDLSPALSPVAPLSYPPSAPNATLPPPLPPLVTTSGARAKTRGIQHVMPNTPSHELTLHSAGARSDSSSSRLNSGAYRAGSIDSRPSSQLHLLSHIDHPCHGGGYDLNIGGSIAEDGAVPVSEHANAPALPPLPPGIVADITSRCGDEHDPLTDEDGGEAGLPSQTSLQDLLAQQPDITSRSQPAYRKTQIETSLVMSYTDNIFSLTFALFINSAILIVAAATFSATGEQVDELKDAHALLVRHLGKAMGVVFAVALLFAGSASTITGTLAGTIVMDGFLGTSISRHVPPWLRRLITRLVVIMPAMAVAITQGDRGTNQLLVTSQVILSIQLPFTVIPLVWYVAQSHIMSVQFTDVSETPWPMRRVDDVTARVSRTVADRTRGTPRSSTDARWEASRISTSDKTTDAAAQRHEARIAFSRVAGGRDNDGDDGDDGRSDDDECCSFRSHDGRGDTSRASSIRGLASPSSDHALPHVINYATGRVVTGCSIAVATILVVLNVALIIQSID